MRLISITNVDMMSYTLMRCLQLLARGYSTPSCSARRAMMLMKSEKMVVLAAGEKHEADRATTAKEPVRDAPPAKREESSQKGCVRDTESKPQTGPVGRNDYCTARTIERGHIYFVYRPRVQMEEASSIDDVKSFHMLLVPRPPECSTYIRKPDEGKADTAYHAFRLLHLSRAWGCA
jgi:hypothetical protein